MCARSALLYMLVIALDAWAVLEQPAKSTMPLHPAFKCVLDLHELFPWCQKHVCETWMGAFGGATPKEHMLVSNKWWIFGMARDKPDLAQFGQNSKTVATTEVVEDAGGNHRKVTGGSETQRHRELHRRVRSNIPRALGRHSEERR